MRVISFTTIPPRFSDLSATLESLTAQNVDEVRLYIPKVYKRFPDWDGLLPDVPQGVTIQRTEQDFGPATKILPAVRDLRGADVQILFCDDDCFAPPRWAERLFTIQARRPNEAVATYVRPAYLTLSFPPDGRQARQIPIKYDLPFRTVRLAHKILGFPHPLRRPFVIPGYGAVLFGVGGAVVRPNFFDEQAFSIPDIAWPVDDIWLSANLARKNIPIYCPWLAPLPKSHSSAAAHALADETFLSKSRQELNMAASEYCRDAFGIWV